MLPFLVIPGEPSCQVFGKLNSRFVCLQVDALVLQGAPEPLDEDVILEAPFAVHADFHVPCFQHGRELLAGKLAPLV